MKYSAAQIRGKIKNLAKENNADPRLLLRIYMMERFLERVSLSSYKDSFIFKGGILVTSLVGASLRSTMDIDASIRNFNLDENTSRKVIENIIEETTDDSIAFRINKVETIMDEMDYPGIRVHLEAVLEQMVIPIKVDISTGDAITPREIEYQYKTMLDDKTIPICTYNLETLLAEKLQTVLVRERANTRMRDYYDIFSIMNIYDNKVNSETFKEAYSATRTKRNTKYLFGNEKNIISKINNDEELLKRWNGYQNKYSYAKTVTYIDTITAIEKLIAFLK